MAASGRNAHYLRWQLEERSVSVLLLGYEKEISDRVAVLVRLLLMKFEHFWLATGLD